MAIKEALKVNAPIPPPKVEFITQQPTNKLNSIKAGKTKKNNINQIHRNINQNNNNKKKKKVEENENKEEQLPSTWRNLTMRNKQQQEEEQDNKTKKKKKDEKEVENKKEKEDSNRSKIVWLSECGPQDCRHSDCTFHVRSSTNPVV